MKICFLAKFGPMHSGVQMKNIKDPPSHNIHKVNLSCSQIPWQRTEADAEIQFGGAFHSPFCLALPLPYGLMCAIKIIDSCLFIHTVIDFTMMRNQLTNFWGRLGRGICPICPPPVDLPLARHFLPFHHFLRMPNRENVHHK